MHNENKQFELAGVGARSLAYLIDWHIKLLVTLAVVAVLYVTNSSLITEFSISNNKIWFLPLSIYFLYHPILEILLRGSTPGKKIAGIHIVNLNGEQAHISQLIMRNIMRIIDGLPVFYSLGILACLLNKEQQRLGDKVAGTLLVYVN